MPKRKKTTIGVTGSELTNLQKVQNEVRMLAAIIGKFAFDGDTDAANILRVTVERDALGLFVRIPRVDVDLFVNTVENGCDGAYTGDEQ